MVKPELEHVIDERIQPLVDSRINSVIGMALPPLSADISDRLKNTPHFAIDTSIPFKRAKILHKKYFLSRLLTTFGSITDVARIAQIKRESVHRLIKDLDITAESDLRKYGRDTAIRTILEDSLRPYERVLHPSRITTLYQQIPQLTLDIVSQLPDEPKTLKDSEHEFERAFIAKALADNAGNISQTARAIGLRFETLHRKMKQLGIGA